MHRFYIAKDGRYFLASLFLLGALFILCLFGVVGLGRPPGVIPFSDVRFFYIAGSMLAKGENPYVYDSFKIWADHFGLQGNFLGVFAYPPQSFFMWLPLSLLDFDQARWVWTMTSLSLMFYSIFLTLKTLKNYSLINGHVVGGPEVIMMAALMIANPFVSHVIWTGQSSFIVLAALVLFIHSIAKNGETLPGLCLALSTIKPQLSIFAFLWIIFSGNWRVFSWALFFLLIMLVLPLCMFGPHVVVQWLTSASAYQGEVSGGLNYNTNIGSLFAAYDVPSFFKVIILILSVIVMFYVSRYKSKSANNYIYTLALISISGLLFIYGRDYDLAILISLVAMLWMIARNSYRNAAIVIVCSLLFFFPQRYSDFGIKIFEFRKIVLLIVAWAFVCFSIIRDKRVTGMPSKLL